MKHSLRKSARVLSMVAVLSLTGCNHVAYVHNAVLGIDLTTSTEGTNRFTFGYDSETFAIVPRHDAVGDGKHGEAMTLVSVSNIEANGVDDITFNNLVATGTAAHQLARDPDGLKLMRAAVFGDETAK